MPDTSTKEDFYEIIRNGDYTTAPDNRPAHALGCGIRSWWRYYVGGLYHQVANGARLARRGAFSETSLGDLSFGMMRATESTGATVSFENFDHLSALRGKPFVAIANHISLIETMVLPVAIFAFNNMTLVAKRGLLKYPGFGAILKACRTILVDRRNARQDLAEVLKQGVSLLNEGISILLFPQGSRSEVFETDKFNSLGAKLAAKAHTPLIPIACKTDIARRGFGPFRDFGPIDPARPVRFCAGSILTSGNARQNQEEALKFIAETLDSWKMPVKHGRGLLANNS